MMNPSSSVNLVTGCGAGPRTAPQDSEELGLRLTHAGQQRIIQGAPRFQAERVVLDGNAYPTPLELG
jgi:hypothetical protein